MLMYRVRNVRKDEIIFASRLGSKFRLSIYYIRQGYVLAPSVCLSVAALNTEYWSDFHEQFTRDVYVDREELV